MSKSARATRYHERNQRKLKSEVSHAASGNTNSGRNIVLSTSHCSVPTPSTTMPTHTRLKYEKFKPQEHQDVDDWMEQYLAVSTANEEAEDAVRLRIFPGLLSGEALKWYNAQEATLKIDWAALKVAFEKEFRDEGADARVLGQLNKAVMGPKESLRKYTQRIRDLMSRLTIQPTTNLQIEWFIGGLEHDVEFEVRKSKPASLAEAITTAKDYEESLKQMTKGKGKFRATRRTRKVDPESGSEASGSEGSSEEPGGSKRSQILKVVKKEHETQDQLKSIIQAVAELKVQMADLKAHKKPIPLVRTGIFCRRCKKEGHYEQDCTVDWKQILADEKEEYEAYVIQQAYQQQGPSSQGYRQGGREGGYGPGMYSYQGPPPQWKGGRCYRCQEFGHISPNCPNERKPINPMLCNNCHQEGHLQYQCTLPPVERQPAKMVPNLPRAETAMKWSNTDGAEGGPHTSDVKFISIDTSSITDCRKVSTRAKAYPATDKQLESTGLEGPVEESTDDNAEEDQDEYDDVDIPDVSAEISEEIRKLHRSESQKEQPMKKKHVTFKLPEEIPPRSDPHYDIIQDISSQLANVTIGQLLRDSLLYRKQLQKSLITPRRKRMRPPVNVNWTKIEALGSTRTGRGGQRMSDRESSS